jgi:hypothetical protein
MIDRKSLAREVEQARAARCEAEDAWCAVEELLWALRDPRAWRRLTQVDDEADAEDEPPARRH